MSNSGKPPTPPQLGGQAATPIAGSFVPGLYSPSKPQQGLRECSECGGILQPYMVHRQCEEVRNLRTRCTRLEAEIDIIYKAIGLDRTLLP